MKSKGDFVATTRPDKHGHVVLVPLKSDIYNVRYCATRVHWKNNFLRVTRTHSHV